MRVVEIGLQKAISILGIIERTMEFAPSDSRWSAMRGLGLWDYYSIGRKGGAGKAP